MDTSMSWGRRDTSNGRGHTMNTIPHESMKESMWRCHYYCSRGGSRISRRGGVLFCILHAKIFWRPRPLFDHTHHYIACNNTQSLYCILFKSYIYDMSWSLPHLLHTTRLVVTRTWLLPHQVSVLSCSHELCGSHWLLHRWGSQERIQKFWRGGPVQASNQWCTCSLY